MRRSLFYTVILLAMLASSSRVIAQATWFTPENFGLLAPPSSVRYDDIYFISHDTGVVVSSYGMIFKTYDGAAHWWMKKAITEYTYFRSVEFSADGQVGIAGTLSGTIYRSTDRGETWDDISANISDTGKNMKRICGLAHNGNTFYGVGWWGSTRARVYKSTDAGLTWTTTYLDTNLATGLVDAVFLSATKGFITGCRDYANGTKRESVVLRTDDGGATWNKVFSDTTIGGRIWKIQFVDDVFGVGSVEPMYRDTVAMIRTLDGGATWQLLPAGHVDAWTTSYGTQGVGFMNRQKGWLGGYYNGMFETNDGGLTWDYLPINEKCDRFFIKDNTMYLSANTVYKYNGEYHAGTGNVSEPVYLHKLYPIAPNPAKGTIHIEFDINAHQTNTVLEIISVDGRTIYPVTSGYLKPGHYSYTWDGTAAPAGNYIVWLGTDEIPMVQKFVLNK
ncbi:MAG: hypothetical protein JWQ38_1241 [Flavipsychrobacter sp.]|nr:hypothetical protein [Flavipsychrobacter sp.]